MKKLINYIAISLSLAFIAGCCSKLDAHNQTIDPHRWASNQNNVNHLLHSTVSLLDPETVRPSCSGFFIAPDIIMSARHCYLYEEGKRVVNIEEELAKLRFAPLKIVKYGSYASAEEYELVPVEILDCPLEPFPQDGEADVHDIILLKVKDKKHFSKHWLKIATKLPQIGGRVYNVSLPEGQPWIFAEGVVAQYYYDWDNFPEVMMLAIGMSINFGSSGSAVVDTDGNVIGIAHRMSEDRQNSIFVPAKYLRAFAEPFLPKEK